MQPHPAPFSAPIIGVIRELMKGERRARVCDPYGGTGRVLDALWPGQSAVIIDIEPSFIQEGLDRIGVYPHDLDFGDEVGVKHLGITSVWHAADSRSVLRRRKTFTHIITSPDYGNRFTDKHNPAEGRKCRSYAQSKGSTLEPGNTAQYAFHSDEYSAGHREILAAAVNRLVPGGTLIINVSDFYRTVKKGEEPVRQRVVDFWMSLCTELGLNFYSATPVFTRRFKEGENRHRAEYEMVLVYKKENVDVRTRTR